jgi:hypothetical protein
MICRRVVGRSATIASKSVVAYLVRWLGLDPNLPLTTGTFNLLSKTVPSSA